MSGKGQFLDHDQVAHAVKVLKFTFTSTGAHGDFYQVPNGKAEICILHKGYFSQRMVNNLARSISDLGIKISGSDLIRLARDKRAKWTPPEVEEKADKARD